jgi:hypothetical protein
MIEDLPQRKHQLSLGLFCAVRVDSGNLSLDVPSTPLAVSARKNSAVFRMNDTAELLWQSPPMRILTASRVSRTRSSSDSAGTAPGLARL